MVENSDVIKHTLFSLVNVASTKTSEDYAWSIIKTLLKELKENYDFLKYIKIDNLEYLENTIDDITIMSDLDNVNPTHVGKAIQDIIDIFKTRMGKKAGYFFIKEFRDDLGEEYHSIIKEMGVDLRLIDLQNEVYGISSSQNYKIKDDNNINIAFIEKKEKY